MDGWRHRPSNFNKLQQWANKTSQYIPFHHQVLDKQTVSSPFVVFFFFFTSPFYKGLDYQHGGAYRVSLFFWNPSFFIKKEDPEVNTSSHHRTQLAAPRDPSEDSWLRCHHSAPASNRPLSALSKSRHTHTHRAYNLGTAKYNINHRVLLYTMIKFWRRKERQKNWACWFLHLLCQAG